MRRKEEGATKRKEQLEGKSDEKEGALRKNEREGERSRDQGGGRSDEQGEESLKLALSLPTSRKRK